jgi:hypothetical protein
LSAATISVGSCCSEDNARYIDAKQLHEVGGAGETPASGGVRYVSFDRFVSAGEAAEVPNSIGGPAITSVFPNFQFRREPLFQSVSFLGFWPYI